ncbi:hypothetical protein SARC_08428 [Sphaeroforma arctica JP610]|uniref:Uncharacterized protein n=1 Tax=Sphaeroforma arctica JP610 TaxID=667725 RepID=A0A0L0FR57_9EUKA|nr:hypothetical protein SARC_08428 [Sphaeroforma arctica JP610]KNC79164.1 hypothetical protein SARC_08428 [Sphaeroforma arctica JP610]|eukprot:XP_014153066.1 hypothetical protein SARC_08428 [Sphaeroforma arctica JP610]
MVTKLQNINDLPEVDANAGAKVGEALEKAAKIIKPVVEVAKKIVNNVGPVLEKGVQWCEEKYPIIEPYNPTELLPAIIGLVLVFYGGHFMLTVSAVEAFRMIGYQDVKEALIVFHKNWKAIQVANQKDNTIDADGDGIADVEQITAKEKTSRKMLLVLRTIDPAEVQKAYHACLMSWGAIIVTLKMNFAERSLAIYNGI